MVRLFSLARLENFQNKRNILRGSPQFPAGIPKRKLLCSIYFFLPVPGPVPIVRVAPDSL